MRPILILAALAAALSVQAQEAAKTDSVEGFKFTDVKTVKTNPVRDQNKSGTCWCFSSNSFFENEIIRKGGKPVDLSEMFVVWHTYDDKADKYIRTNGKINFSQGGSGLRESSTLISARYRLLSNTRERPIPPRRSHSRSASTPTTMPHSPRLPIIRSTNPLSLKFPTTGLPDSI